MSVPAHPWCARALPLLPLLLLSILPACSVGGAEGDPATPRGEVVVLAAASLADAFAELGEAFATTEGGATVTLGLAASSRLATQIVEGAPGDVFASADPVQMSVVTEADRAVGEPVVFARNRMAIVVASGNPLGITDLGDLADEDLILAVCAPQAPCGRYAAEVFDRAAIVPSPDSFEENPRAVLTKVILGEADAGIVYATDVIAAGDRAEGIEIPAELDVVAEYLLVDLVDADDPGAARAFVEFVLSEPGRQILELHGFVAP